MKYLRFHHDQQHPHDHSHGDTGHCHSKDCSSLESDPQAEALALLQYLLNHNVHHAEELHQLAHDFSGAGAQAVHQAVTAYEDGNQKLKHAISLLKGE